MPEQLYKEALRVANQKVLRQKQNLAQESSHSSALSSSMIKSMFGRFYQIGDSWDVAVWPISQVHLAMTSTPVGEGGLIHYEITDIKNGTHPSVTLKITQQASNGLKIIDSKVEYVSLEFSDQFVIGKKSFHLKNEALGITASTHGVRTGRGPYSPIISPLDLLPIDVPDITTAESAAASEFPALPNPVKDIADQSGIKPDLNQCTFFKQEDFFGRPIEVLWQKGNPWPSYIKTSTGIALLTRKGTV
jgi:hypothetical protein